MNGGRRFHLVRRLGAGAYGEVVLAEQESASGFRRRVALKLLHPHLRGLAEAGRRMRDEARILGRLSHRHIVTALDLVRLEDRWAVVMDYVKGADLGAVLASAVERDEALPACAALEVGVALLSALDAAWNAEDGQGGRLEVVHRDIKPSNVMLTADGDVKVLDFGVARAVNLEGREAMTGLQRVGTERYMAPERLAGEGDTHAGDVYAAVATLVELLAGEPVGRARIQPDDHAILVDTALARVAERVGEPLASDLAPHLRAGLAWDLEDRPSAHDLAMFLESLSRNAPGPGLREYAAQRVPPIQARSEELSPTVGLVLSERSTESEAPATWVPGGVLAEHPEVPTPTLLPPPPRPRSRRGPWIAGAASVAVAVALCVGVVASLSDREVTEPVPPVEESTPTVEITTRVEVEEPAAEPSARPEPSARVEVTVAHTAPARITAPPPAPSTVLPGPEAPPLVPAAMVIFEDASDLRVTCGPVEQRGTTAVRIKDFPAGPCQVEASFLDQQLRAEVIVDRKREVHCAASEGVLSCS